jgi:hypothetical protein
MTLEKPGTTAKLGSYELLKELPGSGIGATWIARSAGDAAEEPTIFSVLRVPKHLTKKPETVEAILSDTLPARDFRHPNAVALVDVGTQEGEVYLASEYHEGDTLTGLIAAASAQGLPQPIVLRILVDVLGALEVAHTHEPALFHGELGPQHVHVGEDGVARVAGIVSAGSRRWRRRTRRPRPRARTCSRSA